MIRRFFTRILIIVLITVCVYNWMQTQRLQAQVAALEARAAQTRQSAVIARTREAHSRFYKLQEQWKRLQHQAGAFRLAGKKVLSYVI